MLNNKNSEFTRMAIAMLAMCFTIGVIGRMIPEHYPNLVSPFSSEFDWTRSTIATIFSISAITTGVSGPFAGYLFDKLGPARVYGLGFCFSGGGLILAGFADSLWQFQLGLGVFVGFSAACCGNVTNSALVSRWFQEKLPLALSIIFSAIGVGSFLGLSLSQILISQYGWRTAEIAMGTAIVALLPILLILPWKKLVKGKAAHPISKKIDDLPALENWTLKSASKTVSFWGLAAVFFITANGIYSIIFQSVTYLIENGLSPVEGSFNVGLTGAFVPFGMIFCGYLLTRFKINYIALGTYVITIIGVTFLWLFQETSQYWAVVGFIIFFGLTMGTRAPIVGSLSARIFRGNQFGLIYGCISMGGGLGAASGAYLSGWIYDATSSYDAVFTFSLACLIAGTLPFIVIPNIRKHS
ncbi:MAG: MFS transporter [Sneathiella sp.]|nr:MFS transporter [Sneathiella sp.]